MVDADHAATNGPSIHDDVLDEKRLTAVALTGLLDTPADAAFDDLTRLAAVLVGAPLAFATIVDDTRSFWKSCFGIAEGAPRQNTVEESFCQYVVRSRRELVVTDASIDARTRDNPSVRAMGVRAWAGFPLLAPGGAVLGSFCVVDTQPRSWTERDLHVLRTLADAASREIALRESIAAERRARLHAEDVIHTLQATLLPPVLPTLPGMELAARFRPGGTGIELVGDFYDIFKSRDDRWSFVVGDICGKGLEAAKAASLARHTIGAMAMQKTEPSEVMSQLNETFIARRGSQELFLTAVYGVLQQVSGGWTVSLACAGHAQPILRRAGGSTFQVDVAGPLIGVFSPLDITNTVISMYPGDSLTVYTDGVSEARRGSTLFGDEAVCRLIATTDVSASAAELAHVIEAAAVAFCGGLPSDDIAILVLRVPPDAAV